MNESMTASKAQRGKIYWLCQEFDKPYEKEMKLYEKYGVENKEPTMYQASQIIDDLQNEIRHNELGAAHGSPQESKHG